MKINFTIPSWLGKIIFKRMLFAQQITLKCEACGMTRTFTDRTSAVKWRRDHVNEKHPNVEVCGD